MIETEGKILKWGNSLGIRLNKAEFVNSGLNIDDKVSIKVEKKITKVKDIFGKFPTKGNTQKELDEIDKELWNL